MEVRDFETTIYLATGKMPKGDEFMNKLYEIIERGNSLPYFSKDEYPKPGSVTADNKDRQMPTSEEIFGIDYLRTTDDD